MTNPIMTELLAEARIRDFERETAAHGRATQALRQRRYLRRTRRGTAADGADGGRA